MPSRPNSFDLQASEISAPRRRCGCSDAAGARVRWPCRPALVRDDWRSERCNARPCVRPPLALRCSRFYPSPQCRRYQGLRVPARERGQAGRGHPRRPPRRQATGQAGARRRDLRQAHRHGARQHGGDDLQDRAAAVDGAGRLPVQDEADDGRRLAPLARGQGPGRDRHRREQAGRSRPPNEPVAMAGRNPRRARGGGTGCLGGRMARPVRRARAGACTRLPIRQPAPAPASGPGDLLPGPGREAGLLRGAEATPDGRTTRRPRAARTCASTSDEATRRTRSGPARRMPGESQGASTTATRWDCRTPRRCRRRTSMGMDYLPVYEGEDGRRRQRHDLARQDPAHRRRDGGRSSSRVLSAPVRVPGAVQLDERRISVVATRSDAFIEKVGERHHRHHVQKGQPLVRVFAGSARPGARLIAEQELGPSR